MNEGHNYHRIIEIMAADGEFDDRKGQVVHLNVNHDAWCGIWNQERCNCFPEIAERDEDGSPDERLEILVGERKETMNHRDHSLMTWKDLALIAAGSALLWWLLAELGLLV